MPLLKIKAWRRKINSICSARPLSKIVNSSVGGGGVHCFHKEPTVAELNWASLLWALGPTPSSSSLCLFSLFLQVSLVGFLFLLGLYISSLASCMGGLYGAPRILQCIAQERVIPALAFLGRGVGDSTGSEKRQNPIYTVFDFAFPTLKSDYFGPTYFQKFIWLPWLSSWKLWGENRTASNRLMAALCLQTI